jgi:hypothetical protein
VSVRAVAHRRGKDGGVAAQQSQACLTPATTLQTGLPATVVRQGSRGDKAALGRCAPAGDAMQAASHVKQAAPHALQAAPHALQAASHAMQANPQAAVAPHLIWPRSSAPLFLKSSAWLSRAPACSSTPASASPRCSAWGMGAAVPGDGLP